MEHGSQLCLSVPVHNAGASATSYWPSKASNVHDSMLLLSWSALAEHIPFPADSLIGGIAAPFHGTLVTVSLSSSEVASNGRGGKCIPLLSFSSALSLHRLPDVH